MEKEEQKFEETKLGIWGNNTFGQLALDNTNTERNIFIPKLITFEIHISEISCGFQHTVFRSVEGDIYVTGDNSKGQLGIEKKIKRRTSPTAVQLQDVDEKVLLV
jgi:alpha-tubulin suppressor-like RCC1 family protein